MLIENCVRTTETHFDANEEIEMKLATPQETLDIARRGEMEHALMLAALAKAVLLRPQLFAQ